MSFIPQISVFSLQTVEVQHQYFPFSPHSMSTGPWKWNNWWWDATYKEIAISFRFIKPLSRCSKQKHKCSWQMCIVLCSLSIKAVNTSVSNKQHHKESVVQQPASLQHAMKASCPVHLRSKQAKRGRLRKKKEPSLQIFACTFDVYSVVCSSIYSNVSKVLLQNSLVIAWQTCIASR